MTQPLALVQYERLFPGSQLVNRLQDLSYRVRTISNPKELSDAAGETKPIVVLIDVEAGRADTWEGVATLRRNPATSHLPIIAFGAEDSAEVQAAARASGATLLVSETAILTHLPQLLEQALQVE
jgi:PleD family two-component response regulator